jgi:hypothetical protein
VRVLEKVWARLVNETIGGRHERMLSAVFGARNAVGSNVRPIFVRAKLYGAPLTRRISPGQKPRDAIADTQT